MSLHELSAFARMPALVQMFRMMPERFG